MLRFWTAFFGPFPCDSFCTSPNVEVYASTSSYQGLHIPSPLLGVFLIWTLPIGSNQCCAFGPHFLGRFRLKKLVPVPTYVQSRTNIYTGLPLCLMSQGLAKHRFPSHPVVITHLSPHHLIFYSLAGSTKVDPPAV
jgi:hypothetical protein